MITTVGSAAAGSSAAEAAMKQSTGMNKDDFLKLFVTQLQNQDPLNPQDGTQFIGQLAQLTQVEQAYNTNTNLQNMLNQASNSATLAAVSLIGKQVEAPGSQVNLQAGTPASINFSLAQAADQVTVSVQDGNGTVVKTLTAGAKGAGAGNVTWDGTDNAGAKLASGAYTFSISAMGASGNSVASTSLIKGKVDGVDMSGATPVLSIGSVKLSLTDVTSVSGGV
ncbi:MAG: flagellar hook capping protein [Geobacteraceae bacterium GWC2_58_44]|nr:MAG: flagellar hook capping protein [Geobacteraceae bacterium GWC2_58_44]HBG04974.1 flagellar hook capping protein [Geobacter sp.]